MTPTTEGNETFRSLSGNSNVALPLSSNQRLVNRPRLLHWHLMERKTLTDFKPVQEMWEITSNWYYKSAVTSESWGCEWSWKCFWFYIQWIHREETPFVVLFFNTWTKCPTDLSWYKKKNAQKKELNYFVVIIAVCWMCHLLETKRAHHSRGHCNFGN